MASRSPKKTAASGKSKAAKTPAKKKAAAKPKATAPAVAPEETVDDAARAAALANLVGSGDAADQSSVGGTDDPAPRMLPTLSGVVHEWGGETDHVVVATNYHHQVGDLILTARTGDIVRVPDPERGLQLGVLADLDDSDD